jgi:hypothetical protein
MTKFGSVKIWSNCKWNQQWLNYEPILNLMKLIAEANIWVQCHRIPPFWHCRQCISAPWCRAAMPCTPTDLPHEASTWPEFEKEIRPTKTEQQFLMTRNDSQMAGLATSDKWAHEWWHPCDCWTVPGNCETMSITRGDLCWSLTMWNASSSTSHLTSYVPTKRSSFTRYSY